jgi:predicted AAA+ superfamily ATPase
LIVREAIHAVDAALARQAAVALIGPRQIGKTTLAHTVAESIPSVYLDLESEDDRAKLADPALFLRGYEDRLVVLDEIHRMPEIFPALRGLIDRGRRQGRRTGRFLILGSASIDLLRQSSESLAGRIAYIEMGPFSALEIADAGRDANALWVRGGFPDSYLAASDGDSMEWRRDFIRTYLERDIPLFGPRVPAQTMERLWTMLAHEQGAMLNASKLAMALMVSAQSVTRYVDLLVDLLLVRRLMPYQANVGKRLAKSPKTYVRDSGLVHALLGLKDLNAISGHPVAGVSWEGMVIENLIAAAPPLTQASFYRTAVGAEIDLLLDIPGHGLWAFDIKRGLSSKPEKGFHIACEDVKPKRRFLVNAGTDRYPMSPVLEAMGVLEMTRVLKAPGEARGARRP